jgi:hypothetical protein
MLGSLVLLGAGLLLRMRIRHAAAAPRAPHTQDMYEGIGRYRTNVFRP